MLFTMGEASAVATKRKLTRSQRLRRIVSRKSVNDVGELGHTVNLEPTSTSAVVGGDARKVCPRCGHLYTSALTSRSIGAASAKTKTVTKAPVKNRVMAMHDAWRYLLARRRHLGK